MLFVILSSTLFSQIGIGENTYPGNMDAKILGSPLSNDISINPAFFIDSFYTSFTPIFSYSRSGQREYRISSFGFSFPIKDIINIGIIGDVLYTQNFTFTFPPDSNEWDHFTESVKRIGDITDFSGVISLRYKNMDFGLRTGWLNGGSEYRWHILFDKYRDIDDTTRVFYSGYTYGGGFKVYLSTIDLGASVLYRYIGGDTLIQKLVYKAGMSFPISRGNGYVTVSQNEFNVSMQYLYVYVGGGYVFSKSEGSKGWEIGIGGKIPLKSSNRLSLFGIVRNIKGRFEDFEYTAGVSFEFLE